MSARAFNLTMDVNRLRSFLAAKVEELPVLITSADWATMVNAFGATQSPPWEPVKSNAITPVLDSNKKTGTAGLCLVKAGVFKLKRESASRVSRRSAGVSTTTPCAYGCTRRTLDQRPQDPAPASLPAAAVTVAADAPVPAARVVVPAARAAVPAARAPQTHTQTKGLDLDFTVRFVDAHVPSLKRRGGCSTADLLDLLQAFHRKTFHGTGSPCHAHPSGEPKSHKLTSAFKKLGLLNTVLTRRVKDGRWTFDADALGAWHKARAPIVPTSSSKKPATVLDDDASLVDKKEHTKEEEKGVREMTPQEMASLTHDACDRAFAAATVRRKAHVKERQTTGYATPTDACSSAYAEYQVYTYGMHPTFDALEIVLQYLRAELGKVTRDDALHEDKIIMNLEASVVWHQLRHLHDSLATTARWNPYVWELAVVVGAWKPHFVLRDSRVRAIVAELQRAAAACETKTKQKTPRGVTCFPHDPKGAAYKAACVALERAHVAAGNGLVRALTAAGSDLWDLSMQPRPAPSRAAATVVIPATAMDASSTDREEATRSQPPAAALDGPPAPKRARVTFRLDESARSLLDATA